MAKKIIFGLALALIVAGGVFAQEEEEKTSSGGNGVISNWISGEVSLLGGGARYERMLNDKFSIGPNVYFNTFFLVWNEFEVGVSARYYFSPIFFVGAGLGFHIHTGTYEYEYEYEAWGTTYTYQATWFAAVTGVAITPEVGWKIDVRSPGGFFLQPGVKIPITFGTLNVSSFLIGNQTLKGSPFRVGFGIVPYLGLGYAF